MTIVRYEPWSLVNRLNRQFGPLFGHDLPGTAGGEEPASWSPAVDVREEAERFVVQADLPGVEAGDISITADGGVLTLRGERRIERPQQQNGYQRTERVAGAFERRFTLPDNVLAEQISARHSNGVLEIVLPKHAAAQPRQVPISVN